MAWILCPRSSLKFDGTPDTVVIKLAKIIGISDGITIKADPLSHVAFKVLVVSRVFANNVEFVRFA